MGDRDSVEARVDLETAPEPELMGTLHRQKSGITAPAYMAKVLKVDINVWAPEQSIFA